MSLMAVILTSPFISMRLLRVRTWPLPRPPTPIMPILMRSLAPMVRRAAAAVIGRVAVAAAMLVAAVKKDRRVVLQLLMGGVYLESWGGFGGDRATSARRGNHKSADGLATPSVTSRAEHSCLSEPPEAACGSSPVAEARAKDLGAFGDFTPYE